MCNLNLINEKHSKSNVQNNIFYSCSNLLLLNSNVKILLRASQKNF